MKTNVRNFLYPNDGYSLTSYMYDVSVEENSYPDNSFRITDGDNTIFLDIDYSMDKKEFRAKLKAIRDLAKVLTEYVDNVEKAYPEAVKYLANIG